MTVIFSFEVFCEKREWQRAKSALGGQNTVLSSGELNLQFEAIKMFGFNCQSISLQHKSRREKKKKVGGRKRPKIDRMTCVSSQNKELVHLHL